MSVQACAKKMLTREEAISQCRGHNFSILLLDFFNSCGARELAKTFYERKIVSDDNTVSYRNLHHWEALGLIECKREGERGWRKYNLIETVWLRVIQQLRNFGFSLEKISKLKSLFFEDFHTEIYPAPLIEYYFLEAIALKSPIYLLVFEDGSGTLFDSFEYDKALKKRRLGDHLHIELNALLEGLGFGREVLQHFPFIKEFYEFPLSSMIKFGKFDSITIRMKDGTIRLIEATQRLDRSADLNKILDGNDYQDIEIKQGDGQVVSIKRTTKIKI